MDTTLGKMILITREVPEAPLASLGTLGSSRWSSNMVEHQLISMYLCDAVLRKDNRRSETLVPDSRTDNPSRVLHTSPYASLLQQEIDDIVLAVEPVGAVGTSYT